VKLKALVVFQLTQFYLAVSLHYWNVDKQGV
jgi:hypothetical protein